MLRGCFSLAGTEKLVRVYMKKEDAKYRAMLEENLLEAVKDFQHYKYTARDTGEQLRAKQSHVLGWPNQSQDLNPTKNLGQDFKIAVHGHTLPKI